MRFPRWRGGRVARSGFCRGVGIAVLMVFLSLGAQAAVRVGILADFPPFQIWPAGATEPGGADIDLLQHVQTTTGLDFEYVRYTDYTAMERDLLEGRLQVLSSMALTPTREAKMRFTRPYAEINQAVVARRDVVATSIQPDLSGRSVAVVPGYAHEAQVRERWPEARRVPVKDLPGALDAVRSGQADLVLDGEPVLRHLIEMRGLDGLQVVHRFRFPEGRLRLALGLRSVELSNQLDLALSRLTVAQVGEWVRHWDAVPLHTADAASVPVRAPADLRPVQVGYLKDFPPFMFTDEKGQAQGTAIRLMARLAERCGMRVERYRGMSLSELLEAARAGSVDFALGLTETAARREFLEFLGAYREDPLVIVSRPQSGHWALRNLVGQRVAIVDGHFALSRIAARYPGVELARCETFEQCLAHVQSGRAEAAIDGLATVSSFIDEGEAAGLQITGMVDRLVDEQTVAIVRARAEWVPWLKTYYDRTVQEDFGRIEREWVHEQLQRSRAWERRAAWILGAAGLLMLAMAAAWTLHVRRLRREVDHRRQAQELASDQRQRAERLFAFLAHEVRDVLQAVCAGTAVLRRETNVGGRAQAVQRLEAAARHTLVLLEGLLDRQPSEDAAANAGEMALDLGRLLQPLDAALRPLALSLGHGLEISWPREGTPVSFVADAVRLQRIVHSLALYAMRVSAGHEIRVVGSLCNVAGDPTRVDVEVEIGDLPPAPDPGQGLLQPKTMSLPGDEVGELALCRELASSIGARIELRQPPQGAGRVAVCWRAELAAYTPDLLHDSPPSSAADAVAAPPGPRNRLDIALVESDPVYGLRLQQALLQAGHRAHLSTTLSDLAAPSRLKHIDLVVAQADDDDAAGSGSEPLRLEGGPAVVAMASQVNDAVRQRWLDAGARAVLRKDPDVAKMAASILALAEQVGPAALSASTSA